MEKITSSQNLPNTEHHFRIFAGPGAGKTHWLINHLKHTARTSTRLSSVARIACITYTNVAVENITSRLGASIANIEVSTIHSFLYRNVVAPYLHLLPSELLINYALVDGHDEHHPSYTIVQNWLQLIEQPCQAWRQKKIRSSLKKVKWQLKNGTWILTTLDKQFNSTAIGKRLDISYKMLYWEKGIADHDDVLYFSYEILRLHPTITKFLGARFPYLFLDEFQDTNPAQTQIIKWFAEQGVIIGVIGDTEQAIFVFQGTEREDFTRFLLPGQIDYEIANNRRSTLTIVTFANRLRMDEVSQESLRQVQGNPIAIYVGDLANTIARIRAEGDEEIAILARTRATVESIRSLTQETQNNYWEQLEGIDRHRFRLLKALAQAIVLARAERVAEAHYLITRSIKRETTRIFRITDEAKNISKEQWHGVLITMLKTLLEQSSTLPQSTVMDAYTSLNTCLLELSSGHQLKGIKAGQFRDFAEVCLFSQLIDTVEVNNDTRLIRTIHQSKGAEFSQVLVVIKPDAVKYLLRPNDYDDEEKRLLYVALTRAKDNLALHATTLSSAERKGFRNIGVQIIDI